MERLRRELAIVIILCLAILLTMVLDWMALHDIAKDYVSTEILEALRISTSSLPSWTATRLEWASVEVMFIVRMIIVSFMTIMVYRMIREVRKLQRRGNL